MKELKQLQDKFQKKKPLTNRKVDNLFKNIDKVEVNFTESIRNLYKLKLSILNEQNKNAKEFYLNRVNFENIRPFLKKRLALFRKAYDRDPPWFNSGYSTYSNRKFKEYEKQIWESGRKKK